MLTSLRRKTRCVPVVAVLLSSSDVRLSSADDTFSSEVDEATSSEKNSLLYSGAMPSRMRMASWKVVTSYFQSQSVKLSWSQIDAGH